jgi:peptide/nickel transport system permease protein
MVRFLQQTIFIFILILFLAALPSLIVVHPIDNTLSWNFHILPQVYNDFVREVLTNGLGTYQLGFQERSISKDIGNNFRKSLFIMLAGVHIGIFTSILFGIFISRFKLTRFINHFLNVLAAIPDFIIILLSIIFAVKIYKLTGIRVISLRPDAGALNIWFPMILASIAPTLYLFKLISVKYYHISGEDYIRTAVAKGLALNYINFQHVFKNIEPFIKAELTKVISLAVGNLFIIEYILNVAGITKFIFLSDEIQPISVGLFSMLLISLITYISVRIVFFIFKRGFLYE